MAPESGPEPGDGFIPAPEFQALDRAACAPVVLEDTLRENYELGITVLRREPEKGRQFYVNYSASCTKCKFSLEFTHRQVALVGFPPRKEEE